MSELEVIIWFMDLVPVNVAHLPKAMEKGRENQSISWDKKDDSEKIYLIK